MNDKVTNVKKSILRIVTFILITAYSACDYKGRSGVSEDIQDSKKREVFKSEYKVLANPVIINDTIKFTVVSAWLENQWSYGSSLNKVIKHDSLYQLVIEIKPSKIFENYAISWNIGTTGERYFRSCGKNCLITSVNELPKDVEQWDVQNGWRLDSASTKDIIGKFVIYKKTD